MLSEFEVGDKVIVHAKIFDSWWPKQWWNSRHMDDLVGEVGVVVGVSGRNGCLVRFARENRLKPSSTLTISRTMSFWFPPRSLRLVNPLTGMSGTKLLYL